MDLGQSARGFRFASTYSRRKRSTSWVTVCVCLAFARAALRATEGFSPRAASARRCTACLRACSTVNTPCRPIAIRRVRPPMSRYWTNYERTPDGCTRTPKPFSSLSRRCTSRVGCGATASTRRFVRRAGDSSGALLGCPLFDSQNLRLTSPPQSVVSPRTHGGHSLVENRSALERNALVSLYRSSPCQTRARTYLAATVRA